MVSNPKIMKRVLQESASLLIGLTTASATEQHNSESKKGFDKTQKKALRTTYYVCGTWH